jgi:polar amino acid transport system substrate-binding protein
VAALTGCQFPRDVDGTLARVRGGEMRVGMIESDPWVTLTDGRPGGEEVELVKRLARRLDASVKWVRGSESELITALHGVQLDLVIGGLTRASEWKRTVTLTRPYVTTEIVLAAPPGTEVPDDLDGVGVGVEEHSEAATELERQTDADPVPVERLEDFEGPVAVEDYLLDDLGLVGTNRSLAEDEHVMAVPDGENAWLTELEHFLLDNGEEAQELLGREDRP